MLELVQNHPERAEPILEEHLVAHPDNLLSLRLLGLTKRNLGKPEEAVTYFKQALQLDPDDPETNNQLALTYRSLGNLSMAILYMLNAAGLSPTAQYWTNAGKLFTERRRLDSAEKAFQKAIQLDPTFVSAQYDLALLYGLQGRWSKFFPQYEWRLRYFDDLDPKIPIPKWDGSNIQNKKLLVHGEQGHGDWIHFVRFLSPAREQGAHVILYCPSDLVGLFRPLADEVVDVREPPPKADFRCSVVSLPLFLKHPRNSDNQELPMA
jgi:tetratricopeptide (TPR) repeat protein